LLHGEILASARVYWILIGINDFNSGGCTMETIVAGILHTVEMLAAAHPQSTVVLSSILPFGSASLWHDNVAWSKVRAINHALECYTRMRPISDTVYGHVEFFNATDYFLTSDGEYVNATYMASDTLHPSAAGCRHWGAAIVQRVQSIVAAAAAARPPPALEPTPS
jgi:hypothetical protein